MRGEMPTAHSKCLENYRFPHLASLNEDDGWFHRSVKPSIVSRLRGCHSLLEREPLVEPLHVQASNAICDLAGCWIQTGAMLVGIGLASVVRRMFLGRLPIDWSKRTNIRVPRRL
jgi:hypothetical protein